MRWPGGWRGLLVLGCVAAGAVGGLLLARALAAPDEAGGPASDPGAGARVQSVLAQLLLREAGLSTRHDPLALTAAEVNAFLADVQIRDAPVWPVRVQIAADGVELSGVTTVGRLVPAALGSWAGAILPGSIGGQPVWVAVRVAMCPVLRVGAIWHAFAVVRQTAFPAHARCSRASRLRRT